MDFQINVKLGILKMQWFQEFKLEEIKQALEVKNVLLESWLQRRFKSKKKFKKWN